MRMKAPRIAVSNLALLCANSVDSASCGVSARDEALMLDLEQTPRLGIRRSLKPQQLPTASLIYLSPRARVAYFFEPEQVPETADAEAVA